MLSHKISVSLPESLFIFMEWYQSGHKLKTRSEVISRALKKLQEAELEANYKDASKELDDAFESLVGEDLENETW